MFTRSSANAACGGLPPPSARAATKGHTFISCTAPCPRSLYLQTELPSTFVAHADTGSSPQQARLKQSSHRMARRMTAVTASVSQGVSRLSRPDLSHGTLRFLRRPLRGNALSWAISRQYAWGATRNENMQRGMRLYSCCCCCLLLFCCRSSPPATFCQPLNWCSGRCLTAAAARFVSRTASFPTTPGSRQRSHRASHAAAHGIRRVVSPRPVLDHRASASASTDRSVAGFPALKSSRLSWHCSCAVRWDSTR